MMLHKKTLTTMGVTGSLLAALALTGCGRHDDTTAAADRDTTVARKSNDELHADASKSMSDARDKTVAAGRDVRDATKSTAEETGNKVSDAAITASVNAELAKDPNLSATKIDVDTSGGKVALHGSAPDAAAKDRATQLAQGVKGVQDVDNQLTIKAKR